MSEILSKTVKKICESVNNDRTKLMDIVTALQGICGCVSGEAMDLIARQVKVKRVEVEGVVSFYSFLSKNQKGKVVFRLCNDIVDQMQGGQQVAKALSDAFGIEFGQTTPDGHVTLEYTPCIGMSDQSPAALVNDVVVTYLTPQKAVKIAQTLKNGAAPKDLTDEFGDGNNADVTVRSMVRNNVLRKGEVLFADRRAESGLQKALTISAEDVISEIKTSKLRGRGGAGFPTGLKWEFTRAAQGKKKYVICNADEGEPGTFKDRVLLTEKFDLLCEGMTIGGYAIGSSEGIIYVRGEYAYLRGLLEKILNERRKQGLLGKNAGGKKGFNFDIRVQIGAGAYICGEESALISSCEGLRGDPKTRPPFPAQKGYLAFPTTVNNVETFCCVARIMEKGAAWFSQIGTKGSPGTKLLSISGDCEKPGVYEFPFGVKINDILKETGARDTQAVLVGGPSGQLIGSNDFNRSICYDDMATGGSLVIFNQTRNILKIVENYMDFFVEESCGYCTPCRVGNVLLKKKLAEIMAGKGEPADLSYMQKLGECMKATSRCGLGQTSANPILSSLKNFRHVYEAVLKEPQTLMQPSFDLAQALEAAEAAQGRKSVHE